MVRVLPREIPTQALLRAALPAPVSNTHGHWDLGQTRTAGVFSKTKRRELVLQQLPVDGDERFRLFLQREIGYGVFTGGL